MAAMTRWWWIRHAPVPSNGRIYGQRDLACDCSDAGVFAALAAEVPASAVWVTSHLQRTTQTALAIHAADPQKFADVVLNAVPELAEQHLGDWQGLDRQAFYAARKAGHAPWFAPAHERAPGGESFIDLVERVAPAIERLNRAHGGRDIVAVTHGGTIRAALGLALGVAPQAALAFATENCSLTRIDHLPAAGGSGWWRVVAVNRHYMLPRQGGGTY